MTVHLVGAGPGDPGLLTRRGAELLAAADVVVHDRLVDPRLLDLAPPTAERIDVGKLPGRPHRQQDINELLVERGRTGATVVRLKGGDPFVFGRGGEEVAALQAAGVAVEVVPGVSSAFAVPAAAGVPVTHRGLSTSVTVVTGHVGDPSAPGGVDWASLAAAGGTLVVLMGMEHRAAIAAALLSGGRPPDTPVLVVRWGTTADQRSARTTLAGLGATAMEAPATIVVGPVAGLALGSREERLLHGLRVVVTRPAHQAGPLTAALAEAGAAVVALPVVEVQPPADGGAGLASALAASHRYRWLVCTSANAVRAVMAVVRDGRDLGGVRLAAVGDATAEALARAGLVADLVPAEASATGLVDAMPPPPPAGDGPTPAVLFPRSSAARDTLAAGLRAKGWAVDEVEAYRTGCPEPGTLPPAALAGARQADVVTFASPSAVANYTAVVGPVTAPVACIGPVTADAAARAGMEVAAVAADPSPAALVDALAAWAAGRRPGGH